MGYARSIDETKKAFTLVELLVVIAIIGILVALLLPAVQAETRVDLGRSNSDRPEVKGLNDASDSLSALRSRAQAGERRAQLRGRIAILELC